MRNIDRRHFLQSFNVFLTMRATKTCRALLTVLSNSDGSGGVVVFGTNGTRPAAGSRLASWRITFGDGSSESNSGAPPYQIGHVYAASGTYTATLTVYDAKGTSSTSSVGVTVVFIVETVSPASYGPQPTITCPVGAVSIPAGSTTASRQTLINANPGATFCFQSGTHLATGSNFPTTGQKFYAQYGAVIDGTSWARPEADVDAAPFKAIANGVTGVEIYNLRIKNCPKYAINAYLVSGWKIDHCEIDGNLTGLCVGDSGQVTNNYIHHNIGVTGDPNPALRGGGFAISQTTNVLLNNNEIANNGTEQKFIGSPLGSDNINFTMSNNYCHHNIGNGLWSDGYGLNGQIINNRCEFNGENGICIEKGKSITVSGNTVKFNTQSGILNTESRDCTISNNTLEGNNIDLDLFVDLDDVGTSAWGIDLLNCTWQNNNVTVANDPGVKFATALSNRGTGDFTPYTGMLKSLNFINNTYNVRSSTGNWWNWGVNKNWTQWQALPQDTTGTRNVIP